MPGRRGVATPLPHAHDDGTLQHSELELVKTSDPFSLARAVWYRAHGRQKTLEKFRNVGGRFNVGSLSLAGPVGFSEGLEHGRLANETLFWLMRPLQVVGREKKKYGNRVEVIQFDVLMHKLINYMCPSRMEEEN